MSPFSPCVLLELHVDKAVCVCVYPTLAMVGLLADTRLCAIAVKQSICDNAGPTTSHLSPMGKSEVEPSRKDDLNTFMDTCDKGRKARVAAKLCGPPVPCVLMKSGQDIRPTCCTKSDNEMKKKEKKERDNSPIGEEDKWLNLFAILLTSNFLTLLEHGHGPTKFGKKNQKKTEVWWSVFDKLLFMRCSQASICPSLTV